MPTDLFGIPISTEQLTAKKQPRPGRPWKGGYAAQPGSGPAGETCKTCHHRVRSRLRSDKVFQKCALMRHAWTSGPGCDIKCKTPACNRWQPDIEAKVEL